MEKIKDITFSPMTVEELTKILNVIMKTDDEELEDDDTFDTYGEVDECPLCNGLDIHRQGRCIFCVECGWSTCSL